MTPKLIIYDCDGVLVDSEGVASIVVAEDLTGIGWPMTPADAHRLFLGMSIQEMEPMILARLGHPAPPGWRAGLAAKLLAALRHGVTEIPGAKAMLERTNALKIDWRVASNSSDEEMAEKFAATGLATLTSGRTHSAATIIARGGRPKPAPDLYLAAAASAGAAPEDCLVLEDSPLGVTGAVAAGMTCYGFDPHGDGAALLAAGATRIITGLQEFPEAA